MARSNTHDQSILVKNSVSNIEKNNHIPSDQILNLTLRNRYQQRLQVTVSESDKVVSSHS